MSSVRKISPEQLKTLLAKGAGIAVDVREFYDFVDERIPQAMAMPESNFEAHISNLEAERHKVVFLCDDGKLSERCAKRVKEKFNDQVPVFILAGGMKAWEKAGLPIASDEYQEYEGMPLSNQILIGAAAIVGLLSLMTLLTWKVIALFTLVVAGVMGYIGWTGTKDVEAFLMDMPWNKDKA